jgi:hypothetical protein
MIQKQTKIGVLTLFLLFSFYATSHADLIFTMSAGDYTLEVGQQTTITIWAEITDTVATDNGLNTWQLDMVVDTGGIVEVSSNPVFIEPEADFWDDTFSDWVSLNDDASGNVYGLQAVVDNLDARDSEVGISFFALAEITIEAIGSAGQQAEYQLAADPDGGLTFAGGLRDDTPGVPTYDITLDNLEFQPGNNVFTIVPEPGSLMIMSILAGIAALKRRR